MFEEAFLTEAARTRRPWTVPVSFGLQIIVVGCFVVAPLVFTEKLARARLMPNPVTAPVRLGPARHREGTVVQVVSVSRERPQRGLVLPTRVPDQIAMVVDGPPTAFSDPGPACVGPCGPAGDPNGVLWGVDPPVGRTSTPPPPAVRPPEPVRVATPREPPRIKVGGKVQEARLITRVMPVYPRLAINIRISGSVRLAAVIGTDGHVRELQVLGGHPMLVPAAVEAVRQWVYKPTLLNDAPVEVATEIIVEFNLTRN